MHLFLTYKQSILPSSLPIELNFNNEISFMADQTTIIHYPEIKRLLNIVLFSK